MNHILPLRDGSALPDVLASLSLRGAWDNFVWFVNANPLAAFYIAIALLLLILLLLLRSRRGRRDVSVYSNDGGYAVVSRRALLHLIYIACEDAGLASSPKIDFRQVKGRVNVEVGLKLYQNQKLSEVHELLRKRIRVAVQDTHGIEVGDVSIKVLGFRKDPYREADAENEQPRAGVRYAAPGEASAASLYEEPITGETIAEEADGYAEPLAAQTEGGSADTVTVVEAAPKKRFFGLFGRKQEPAQDAELFVSEDADAPESADGKPTEDSKPARSDS